MALQELDAAILNAVQRYIALQQKRSVLLELAQDWLLLCTPGTVYLKKLGHWPLAAADFENIIKVYGTDEDKQSLADFVQAQSATSTRLEETRMIGFVLEPAEITRDLFYYLLKQPSKWKPDPFLNTE